MSKIVIFGGQGYLGRNIIEGFGQRHKVITLDRYVEKRFKNLEYSHLALNDPDLQELLNSFDPDLFLISYFGNPRETYLESYQKLSLDIVQLIKKIISKPRVVFFSSQLVYGNSPSHTKSENETIKPIEFYPQRCAEMEGVIQEEFNKNFLILRIPIVYGGEEVEKGYKNIISIFINQAKIEKTLNVYKEGNVIRSLIHIDDFISLLEILITEENKFEIVNACFGENYSISDIAHTITSYFSNSNFQFTKWIGNQKPKQKYDIRLASTISNSLMQPKNNLSTYLSMIERNA